jgi:ASC-1-like (ASCH) protein
MAKYSKESLEKLLLLIDEISNQEENLWFRNELIMRFNNNSTGFENFPSFLIHQKKQYKIKGKKFYNSINNTKLKLQLQNDYSEMLWNQGINNINKFLLFAFYQLENMLNYYCSELKAHDKINFNKEKYKVDITEKFKVSCYNSFFKFESKTEIEKVDIWAKIIFWTVQTNNLDWEKANHSNFTNLVQIRNENSHRHSLLVNNRNEKTINNLSVSDFSSLGYYISLLKKIKDSIENENI